MAGNFQEQAADFARKQAEAERLRNTPLFTPKEASAGRYLGDEPLPRSFLLDGLLPVGVSALLIATGGTGKSQLALHLATSIATGHQMCGHWSVGETGQVVCLMAEEEDQELHRRVYRIAQGLPADAQGRVEKNLFVVSLIADTNQLTEKLPSGEVLFTDRLERLRHTLKQFKKLRLVIIDPASRFRGGDENNAVDATRFIEAVESLVKEFGATVLVVHHTNKSSTTNTEPSQGDARGSSALSDGARFGMTLRRMTKDEAAAFGVPEEHQGSYLRADVVKNNYARSHTAPVWLKRDENGMLTKATDLVIGSNVGLNLRKFQIHAAVADEKAAGRLRSRTQFADAFGGRDKPFKIGRDKLMHEIKELILEGVLIEREPTGDEKNGLDRNVRKIIEPGRLPSGSGPTK